MRGSSLVQWNFDVHGNVSASVDEL